MPIKNIIIGTLLCIFGGTATALSMSAPVSMAYTVEITGFKFVPETLTIKLGDTVRWVNVDAAPHTATAEDKSWDSGRLNRQQSWVLTADKRGQFKYICRFHPIMKGTIIVEG